MGHGFVRGAGWLDVTNGNFSTQQSVSDCHVDEPFTCMDSRLKMFPSERHRWILVETSAPLCCNLKTASAHLVTSERGRCTADRMMYHLVGPNDNFISHLHFRRKILPAHFSPWRLIDPLIEANVSRANQRATFTSKKLTSFTVRSWMEHQHVNPRARRDDDKDKRSAFRRGVCVTNGEVIFCEAGTETETGEEKQEVQQRVFVWLSTARPVIYTLMGDGIAARGSGATRGTGREGKELHHWKRELLSAAVVRDKAESSQTPCMINDLWPHCVEAW